MKKLFISLLAIGFSFGMLLASELYISPDQGDFGKNCVLEFDIIASTMADQVMGTDVMLDTSMEFVDFVPGDAFEYSLPPKVSENGVISLGAFSNPDNLFQGEGIIGTIYLKSNEVNNDGYIRFYFKGQGDTSDTNLSIKGGIDTLKEVNNGVYTFNGESCVHEVNNIEGGLAGKDYDKAINDLANEFEKKGKIQKIVGFFTSTTFLVGLGIVVLIIMIILFRIKKGKKS
ncbi:MAG TPA: hypothetical protein VJ892_00935 [Candidatus Absconditabacterales bacterium]|nr:hypothetical protein [Candidatus Absconditabacterales bacterium]